MSGNASPDGKPKDPYGFPVDLKDLQARLHRAHAAYRVLLESLPWPMPLPGWGGVEHSHTKEVLPGRENSPGWTPEQAAEEKRLWDLVGKLSIAVAMHPYWSRPERGAELVEIRMALKHHPDVVALIDGLAETA
ncbi:hypothetical protein ACFY84_26200 [Streptomyces sp. NPDC012438]|uniref:hypothetical protein n=1 Tax=Streptomyces sp. NPDC012438 TaxID=3364833 RepID=UPI0036E59A27